MAEKMHPKVGFEGGESGILHVLRQAVPGTGGSQGSYLCPMVDLL